MHEPGFDDDRPDFTQEDYLHEIISRTAPMIKLASSGKMVKDMSLYHSIIGVLSRLNSDLRERTLQDIIKELQSK